MVNKEVLDDRLLSPNFFKRLKIITSDLNKLFDEELHEDAYKILMMWEINSEDNNKVMKFKLYDKSKKGKFRDYIFELINTYLRAKSTLSLAFLMLDEVESKFKINSDSKRVYNSTYFNTILHFAGIYLENSITYMHSFFDKIGQFLNLYLNINLKKIQLTLKPF